MTSSSRLDRLFLLLDTGSSVVTRKAAALQLGEVQKLHPHELHNLLNKVRHYLHSTSWETRIAASQAVEAIIKNVPQWNPPGIPVKRELSEQTASAVQLGRMKFSQFAIHKVMKHGSDLLASEGKEFDIGDDSNEIDIKEHMATQRQLLNKRLGLDAAEQLGIDTSEIFSNEDLAVNRSSLNNTISKNVVAKPLSEVFQSEMCSSGVNLSKAKRQSRFAAKHRSRDTIDTMESNNSSDCFEDGPQRKKSRVSSSVVMDSETSSDEALVIDAPKKSDHLWEEATNWPFEAFADELMQDLFSPSWEIRHGAATALREVVRLHGRGAGKTVDTPSDEMELVNQLWLEDLALRLLCVLALDKFGDFISDQVVAPVRETCAQALGSVLHLMSPPGVEGVLHILLELLKRPEWEARHGGLLGLKYLLAVREDMTAQVLPVVFQPVFQGLQDPVDDVSAVAAAALIPVKDSLVQLLPDVVPTVVASLWDALLDLDDLTTSTSSILMLLASLLSYSQSNSLNKSLTELVPRLWPFLGHSSSNVRKSVLQALVILTSGNSCQPCETWLPPILCTALRLLYQRCLIEQKIDIQELLYQVWYQMVTGSPLPVLLSAACPFLGGWLSLMMQPLKMPINPGGNNSWLEISHKPKEKSLTRGRKSSASDSHCQKEGQEMYYIGGNESLGESDQERERCATRARLLAAKFLGILSCYVTKPMPGVVYGPDVDSPLDCFSHLILFHLRSKSAVQRQAVAFLLTRWAEFEKDVVSPKTITDKCLECLNESVYYDEIAVAFTRMQQECRDFVALLRHHKLPVDNFIPVSSVLTMEQATILASSTYTSLISNAKLKPKVLEVLEDKRKLILQSASTTSNGLLSLSTSVQASLASALVSLHCIPDKLNPVIRPLMDSIKREENEDLQASSARYLVRLMDLCVSRTPCPNPKVVKNLIAYLCADSNFTPVINISSQATSSDSSADKAKGSSGQSSPSSSSHSHQGILTLVNMQKVAEKANLRRSNSVSSRKSVPPVDVQQAEAEGGNTLLDEVQKQNELQRRGATFCLTEAARYFGASMPQKLPQLWDTMMQPLMDENLLKASTESNSPSSEDASTFQNVINSLQVLEVVAPAISADLHPKLIEIVPRLCTYLENTYAAVRHMAARCLGVLSKVVTEETMDIVLDKVLGMVGATDSCMKRQGAVESLFCIIDNLGLNIVPYIVLLLVPMLGRMSDQNDSVRLMATQCFASLIRLMPLEGGIKDPPNLCPELAERKAQEHYFLEQLMDCRKLENYKLPIPINAELRSYQQQGVNWLAFLNKYKLHGILCDDMGLGKTLQSICILASDHYYREQTYKETKRADCKPLPSLVICPPTLTGHWVYEVEKFVSLQYLNPLHYTGPPMERVRLRNRAKKHNLIIASYDIVRNDIDFFGSFHWNYCILDEGHIIKNGKTKLAKAIKQLSANHRLILTGTPIQNNVLELWSLFDFLMPGFLGTEKQFTARYSKPILQSRDAKSSSKEQEAGVLAMESLHRQVLPFLLRRMKEDVLQDLPPKIIQDYYCDLSALQAQLYEDFAKSQAKRNLEETLKDDESVSVHSTSHIFQALQYLRKVCNHPKLVLTTQHPEHDRIVAQLKQHNTNLADIQHAAKLSALRQLLQDCGIGVTPLTTATGQAGPEPVVNQHRALVFCQLKSMLDIIEDDLFKMHMPGVTYVRLDGSIPPSMRHAVVHRFNNDPSIDVLLLTTQVGGLGLNLTGADTVIFVEHDWNPMKDLQAMDRAHRIGQKKVVNVYRLITRGTLEEKIMGLQKFKLSMANTVISQENSSLQTMGTEQLLDLFTLDDRKKGESLACSSAAEEIKAPRGRGVKAVLESLPELWDAEQYETEYDLANFMQSLGK